MNEEQGSQDPQAMRIDWFRPGPGTEAIDRISDKTVASIQSFFESHGVQFPERGLGVEEDDGEGGKRQILSFGHGDEIWGGEIWLTYLHETSYKQTESSTKSGKSSYST